VRRECIPIRDRATGAKEAAQVMTTKDGRLSWAAKRTAGMTNGVEANERRRRREPPITDWGQAIANLLDILDDEPSRGPVQPQA
jgi:hypothetical protein